MSLGDILCPRFQVNERSSSKNKSHSLSAMIKKAGLVHPKHIVVLKNASAKIYFAPFCVGQQCHNTLVISENGYLSCISFCLRFRTLLKMFFIEMRASTKGRS